MNPYTLALDIGGTKILGAIVDKSAAILFTEKAPTKAGKGKNEVVSQITSLVDSLRKRLLEEDPSAEIDAIGAGCPGLIENGTILFTPNLPLNAFPLKKTLEEAFNVTVSVGNDATLSMSGEWKYGAAKGLTHVIGIFVGTGIGGGLIFNGAVYEGAFGIGSEIGHMTVNPEGPFCGCGAKGCLESVASKTGMLKEIKKQIRRGRESYLERFFEKDYDLLKSSMLREAIEKNDDLAIEVLDEACRYLGVATASLINLLNPEMIVYGGGIVSSLGAYMLPKIRVSARRFALQKNFSKTILTCSSLKDNACLMGAYELASNRK